MITSYEWIAVFGIILEIFGFFFILWFWRVATYPALFKWYSFQKVFKLFFGTKRYEKRLIDIVPFVVDDKQIRPGRLLIEGSPTVPRAFIPFWNRMKWLGFIFVVIGLSLQIVQMID